MEFGIFDHLDRNDLTISQYYEERLKLIELYDRAGFYSYHCAEHHIAPIGMVPSPSVFLAAVAQRTKRLRFGPLVYVLPLYHPLRLIEEICMLDQMSEGRLDMGFGRGSSAAENRYFGQEFAAAQKAYDASLELILDVFAKGTFSVPGAPADYQDMPVQLVPYQKPHPPIWYGVHSVESSERAARRGLQMISLDTAAETRAFVERYREVWTREHGSGPQPKIGISRFIVVGTDGEAARRSARRAYKRWFESFTYTSRLHGYASTHARPAEWDPMAAQGKAGAGTPEEVLAFARAELEASRADYFVGQFAFGNLDPEETRNSVELFAQHVMPALRSAEALAG